MRYTVERREDVQRDLGQIFDFLVTSYLEFGEDIKRAADRATVRLARIETAMGKLGDLPHQGTLRSELLPGVRSVTKERAILYFHVDDEHCVVTVLAAFFGGQDHLSHMIDRLRSTN